MRIVNIVLCVFLGLFGSTCIWTGQFSYVSYISSKYTKGRYFGTFYSFFEMTQIFGNLFNFVFYSLSDSYIDYFTIFVSLCVFSLVGSICLPNEVQRSKIKRKKHNPEQESYEEEIDVGHTCF